MQTVGMVTLAGGVWVFQDSLASILYYVGNPKENWMYNQLLRVLRAVWGLVIIACGILMIEGGV